MFYNCRDFVEKLRPFTRFLSRSEHTSFSEGLWRERELRARIGELIRYRRYGITRVEECAHFERHAAAGGVTRDGETRTFRNPDTPVNGRALAVAARMAVYTALSTLFHFHPFPTFRFVYSSKYIS